MKVAVTGATGFIGSHLVRLLVEQGHEAVVITRAEMTEADTLASAIQGCEAVVHLAGGGLKNERATWQANAKTTRRVIAACGPAGVHRLLLASTVTVTRARVGAYGASKQEAERLALVSDLDATIFRFAFVYGSGQTGVFARLVGIVRRLPLVPVVGTGKLDIAPVYVEDVVAAIVTALERPELAGGKIYTLAGPPATFDELVDGVVRRLGLRRHKLHLIEPVAFALTRLPRSPITRDNVLGMVQEADHDSSLARDELGFSPRPLDAGLDASF
jgi:nucleoside-diphosphate-sugar epimerase